MALWALIENGAAAGFWRADTQPQTPGEWVDCGAETPLPGAHWDGTAFVPAKLQALTSTQFFNRFTLGERAAIFGAARADPQMLQFVVTAAAAGAIDLADISVQTGVRSLVGTLLTAPRAAAILDH